MFKRIISLLLVMAMVCSMAPVQAFAAGVETVPETTEVTTVPAETVVETFEAVTGPTVEETSEAVTEPTVVETHPQEPTESVAETLPVEETVLPTEEVTLPAEVPAETTEETVGTEYASPAGWEEDAVMLGSGYCGYNYSGEPAENLRWYLYDDGTLDIKGYGYMMDYEELTKGSCDSTAPWMVLARERFPNDTMGINRIRLTDQLECIGDYAFCKTAVKTITLPNAVNSIGRNAFAYCSYMKTINIPGVVEWISTGAFTECDSLIEMALPDAITYLDRTFEGCDKLKEVKLPKSLNSMYDVFNGCSSLESIDIPEAITFVRGFRDCTSLKTVKLHKNVKSITLIGCTSLESIEIPEGVETVFFQNCHKLKNIVLPNSLRTLGYNAFENCYSLEEITIPAVKENFGDEVFLNCTGLKKVVFPATGVYTISYDMFSGCSSLEELVLPETLQWISDRAFMGCSSLKEISIPKSTTVIGWYAFQNCTSLERLTIGGYCEVRNFAFESCTSLREINFPEEGVRVNGYAFQNCSSLETVEFTKGIKRLDGYAFNNCDSLVKVVLPETLTGIGVNCFSECDNLQEVEIYAGTALTYGNAKYAFANCVNLKRVYFWFNKSSFIPEAAFKGCENLESVHFLGSEEEWDKIRKDPENEPLTNAQILFNGDRAEGILGTANTAGECATWRVDRNYNLVISGTGATVDFTSWEEQPWNVYRNQIVGIVVEAGITILGTHLFENLPGVKEVQLPQSLTIIDDYAFNQCINLEIVHFRGSEKAWKQVAVLSHNDPIKNADVRSLAVNDFTDNQNIRINHTGSAIAYFVTNQGDVSVVYQINGIRNIVHCDKNGIFAIPLHTKTNNTADIQHESEAVKAADRIFSYNPAGSNIHEIIIEISRIDDLEFKEPVPVTAKVIVEPLTFAQSWTISFDKTVAAGLKYGVGAQLGPVEVEAALIGAEVSLTEGSTINVRREYLQDRQTLELTSDLRMGLGGEVNSGITGDLLVVNPAVYKAKAGVSVVNSGTYGIKTNHYDIENSEQQRAIAAFLLGEQLVAASNDQILRSLCLQLRQSGVYEIFLDEEKMEKSGLELITGSSTGFAAESGADVLSISISGESLFGDSDNNPSLDAGSAVGGKVKGVTTYGYRNYSSDRRESFVSYLLDKQMKAFTDMTSNSLFTKNFLGNDIKITFRQSTKNQRNIALEAMTRHYEENSSGPVRYDVYYLDTEALGKLVSENNSLKRFAAGDKLFLTKKDIIGISEHIAQNGSKTPYTSIAKIEDVKSVKLGAGITVYVDLGLNVAAVWKETLEYDTGSGVLSGDVQMPINTTTDQSSNLQQGKKDFSEIYINAMKSIVKDIEQWVKKEVENVKNGVSLIWCDIKEIPDSVKNWWISLTTIGDNTTEASSYQIKALQRRTQNAAGGIECSNSYEINSVATIGRAVIVGVEDRDTGEAVTDLSAQPLTFVIRYTEADLEAAGLYKDSDIVLDGGIAMYRYNDEGDYFEYIGGVNDLAEMSVTAEITKPGQYVLAADSCAPAITYLNISDFRDTPTITAYIDDLSGLQIDSFVFTLDDMVKVDATTVAEHYTKTSGIFTYTVPENEALSEGKHTMSFTLADSTGNKETYAYSFYVDLTAPVISEVKVEGSTNEDSSVEIRANVSDKNLKSVKALFAKRMPDGTWSEEVSAEMYDLGDGLWGLDYEGDGSVVRVYVRAVDIGENITESEMFEVGPKAEGLVLDQDYIAIKEGQSVQLNAQPQPAALIGTLKWSVDNENVLTVDNSGVITAKHAGTAYVTVALESDENTFTARCRVDVAEALVLDGVSLSSSKANLELYSTNYPELEILLKLPQNYSASAANTSGEKTEKLSAAVSEAYFTDETMAKLFEIRMMDDRTARIVPTAEALSLAKPAKSYAGTITVVVDGKAYETEKLTLSVKTSKPKLKATVAAFNSFYAGQSNPIIITGVTVTGISFDPSKTQPDWLTLEDGALKLNKLATAKNASAKVNLLVETAEWAVPAALTLTVKNTYKVPGVKLAATSVTVSNQPGPASVELKLVPTNKADTISGIGITGITAPEGYTVENFNAETGTFTLKTADGFKAGKIELKVNFGNVTITLNLTVKTQAVKLKLSATKVSLNRDLGDVVTVTVNCLTAGFDVTAPVLTYDAEMLDVQFADGKLTVSAKAAVYGKTYPITVSAYQGGPAVKLNVAILKQNVAVKSTIKATSFIDVVRDSSGITVAPSYTNVLNVDVDNAAVLKIYSSADKFKTAIAEVKAEGGIFVIDNSVISDQTLKYKAQLETKIGEKLVTSSMISLTVKMGTAKLTVKTEDTTLFSKDKNDRALVWFETADDTLNDIARVEFKNAKQSNMFELIDYGDGTYAIAFKDGKVDKSLIGKTVTVALNVFLEGNQTAKANATANVKLTIVK